MTMNAEYCEKCERCHDDGLRDGEECVFYGEPNGCNHPNHGYGVIVDQYEALQKENAELREYIKEAIEDKCESCKISWYGGCVTSDGSPCSLVAKWRAALASASGVESVVTK